MVLRNCSSAVMNRVIESGVKSATREASEISPVSPQAFSSAVNVLSRVEGLLRLI